MPTIHNQFVDFRSQGKVIQMIGMTPIEETVVGKNLIAKGFKMGQDEILKLLSDNELIMKEEYQELLKVCFTSQNPS